MNTADDKLHFIGNYHMYHWNRKLCFEARDSLYDCVDQTENGNKYRCPDQLYAYEMWCPPDFRRVHSNIRSKQKEDEEMFDKDWVKAVNRERETIRSGHYDFV